MDHSQSIFLQNGSSSIYNLEEPFMVFQLRLTAMILSGLQLAFSIFLAILSNSYLQGALTKPGSELKTKWDILEATFYYHVTKRVKKKLNKTFDGDNFWLFSCPGGTCQFNTDQLVRLFFAFIVVPSLAIYTVIQASSFVISMFISAYIIYMTNLPLIWQSSLARNTGNKRNNVAAYMFSKYSVIVNLFILAVGAVTFGIWKLTLDPMKPDPIWLEITLYPSIPAFIMLTVVHIP